MKRLLPTIIAAALCAGTASAQDAMTSKASFVGADGAEVGTASLTGTSSGVLMEIEVSGLPASQWVAFHVHETGTCDHTTGHESAGAHFNPDDKEHGYKAANGPHAGDMPNQYVGTDGVLRAQVFNTFVTLDDAANGIKGKALMVHGGQDDYESQPSGDAGDRLACAVIE